MTGCETRSTSLWVRRNFFWQLSREGNPHSLGMSQPTAASPEPSFSTPWRVGDAMVSRGSAGWTREDISAHARTAHKGLLQKRLEEDPCWTIMSPQWPYQFRDWTGLDWTAELNWTVCYLQMGGWNRTHENFNLQDSANLPQDEVLATWVIPEGKTTRTCTTLSVRAVPYWCVEPNGIKSTLNSMCQTQRHNLTINSQLYWWGQYPPEVSNPKVQHQLSTLLVRSVPYWGVKPKGTTSTLSSTGDCSTPQIR